MREFMRFYDCEVFEECWIFYPDSLRVSSESLLGSRYKNLDPSRGLQVALYLVPLL